MNENIFKVGDLTVRLTPDEDAENPRTDFDHFGRMLCSHRRYSLGDYARQQAIDSANSINAKPDFAI
jgi:hypothetical protein